MKRNLNLLGRIYKIQGYNYINDGSAFVLGFVMIVILTICWMGLKPRDGDFFADPFVLASALGISTIRNAQFNFSNLMADWRLKGTFRRLGQLTVPKFLIGFGMISFSWAVSILILFVIFGIGMFFPEQRRIIAYTDWPIFLSGLLLHTILVSLLAIVPQFFTTSTNIKTTICLVSYFGPMYLLGLGIPLNITANIVWLNYFTYIFPHRYSLALIQAGFIWKAVPGMKLPIDGMIFPGTDVKIPGGVKPGSFLADHGFGFANRLWLVYLLIFVWMMIFGLLIYWGYHRIYRFNLRKYKVYEGLNQRVHYIHQIQRATSLTALNLVVKQINTETLVKVKVAKKKKQRRKY